MVYIGCRDVIKGETAVKDIVALNPKADIKLLKLDLSSLQSVRHFAKELSQLEFKVDILINNVGVFGCPEGQTIDGFEMHFGTNYLAYCQSKLAIILFTRELATRLTNTRINTYSLNTGAVSTDLQKHSYSLVERVLKRYCVLNPFMGSQTTLYCVLDDSLDNESGFYY
ncbi:unnamed protein product, partial [Oppiella nova]